MTITSTTPDTGNPGSLPTTPRYITPGSVNTAMLALTNTVPDLCGVMDSEVLQQFARLVL